MTKKKKLEPPKLPSTGGRPAIDWDLLRDQWLAGNVPKREFLLRYGLSTTSSTTKSQTKTWTQDAKKAEQEAAKIRLQQRAEDKQSPSASNPTSRAGLWQFVKQCRENQAGDDWKTAQAVRSHLKMLLQQSLVNSEEHGPVTRLTPRELCNLAEALERIQKIQRLALGMSTDNVGVVPPSEEDPNVEAGEEESGAPIYLVEVNDQGKFKRARPRQVR